MLSRLPAGFVGLAVFALTACTGVTTTNVSAPPPVTTPGSPTNQSTIPTEAPSTASPEPATPTATPIPPTATATSEPATATPEPSPTAVRRWPLDGAPLGPDEEATRRPIVAKIDNHPDARPPTGLSFADVVVEAPAEGGITRFDAVFHHDLPPVIGPIRSARLIDLSLVPWFDGLFLHVGASNPIMGMLRDSPLADIDQVYHGQVYWRSSDRVAPYNVYADPLVILDYAEQIGHRGETEVESLMFYDGGPPVQPDDRPGPSLRLDYSPAAQTAYAYDSQTGLYLRSIGGTPHVDAANGKQIAAANVAVMETSVVETDIVEDVYGNLSLRIDTVGEGEATIFRDGRAISGTWRRPSVDAMIRFDDAQGEPILLKPGQTWIQIIPAGMPFTS